MKCSFSINAITYKLSHLRLTVKLYYQEKMSVLTRVIALKDFHERNFVPTFFFFFLAFPILVDFYQIYFVRR